ncbi:MAG: PepSY domain-containing protein [Solirubrobacteraceae bacterium]
MGKIRSTLVTAAACGAAAVGGGAIANAATSSGSGSTTSTTPSAPAPAGAPQGAAPAGASYGSAPQAGAGFNPSQGGHTANGKTEKLLTGDLAEKVRAAALAKVSGSVERVETNVDDSAPYEAHIVKSDGTQVIVEVNNDFTVHAVQSMGGHP